MNLHDRSILITGAGSGIGRALALQLADHAPRLTLVGRRTEPLEEVAAHVRERGGQALVVASDLTSSGAPSAIVAAAEGQFGGIDVLVNNAGNVRAGRLEAAEESDVLAQVALNLTAPILLTRAALPALRRSGDGLVVNVSSGIALIGMPSTPPTPPQKQVSRTSGRRCAVSSLAKASTFSTSSWAPPAPR
jgi:uncharacterized oxidoreductase